MNTIRSLSANKLFAVDKEINLTDIEQTKVAKLLSQYSGDVANNAGFTLLRISKELKLAELIERVNENGVQVHGNLPFGKEVIRYADSQQRNYSLILVSNDQVLSESLIFQAIPTTIAVCLFAAKLFDAKGGRIFEEGARCSEELDEGNFTMVKWVDGGIALTAGSSNKIRDPKMIRIT